MSSSSRSWATDVLDPAAVEALARGLPATEVWSLLLEVMERRAAQRAPADLVRQLERDGFTRPAPVDQRTLHEIDGHLLAAASAFEALELSPVAPLGACSVVGLASQNKVLSALRGTEVVSDPTNVLALESARRLREDAAAVVRFATCHRCVRAQAVPNVPGFAPHFRIFCLTSAGVERKDHAFLVDELTLHIRAMLAALERLAAAGFAVRARGLHLFATPAREALADRIAAGVEGLPVVRAPLEHAYYHGLRYQIVVESAAGDDVPLIDGGAFDWLSKLLSNRRAAYVASGLGAQLVAFLWGRRA